MDTIKQRLRRFNGTDYDTVHLETDGSVVEVKQSEVVSILNTDSPVLGDTTVYFTAYPDIKWCVDHIDGDYVYLGGYNIFELTKFGSNATYAGSTIAQMCTDYLNNVIPNVADYLEDVTVEGVTNKVFIPTYYQFSGDSSYGGDISGPVFGYPSASVANRKACSVIFSNYFGMWLSSVGPSTSEVWYLHNYGLFDEYGFPDSKEGFRPEVKVNYKQTMPITTTKDLNTVISEKASTPYQTRIAFSTTWQGSDPYTQEITVEDATENSRVDLHPNASTLTQLAEDGVSALYIENTNGTFTANAVGGPPSTSMLMLATVTEVEPAAQIPNTMTLSKSSISLNLSKTSDTFTIEGGYDGVVTVTSNDTSIATASLNGNVVTVSGVTGAEGSATITVSATGDIYTAANKTLAVTFSVNPAKNLNVGDTFQFGRYQVGSETPTLITWRIVHQTSTRSICMPTSILDIRCFDAKEPNNSNNDRKNHGNNNIGQANLIQWLNSSAAAGSWYTAQHTADQIPSNSYESTGVTGYDTKAGFLNLWTTYEIALLQDVTLTLVNNTVTDGGGTYTKTVKVWCPTEYEMHLGTEAPGVYDGGGFGAFSYFTDNNSRIMKISVACAANNVYSKSQTHTADTAWYYWLGTPTARLSDVVCYVNPDGTLGGNGAFAGISGVVPCIALAR